MNSPARAALRISSAYAVVAIAWKVLSDLLLNHVLPPSPLRDLLQTWKGVLFMVVTATALSWAIYWQSRRLLAAENRRLAAEIDAEKAKAAERRKTLDALESKAALQERLSGVVSALPGVIYAFRQRVDGSVSLPYASTPIESFLGLPEGSLAADAAPIFSAIHRGDIPSVLAGLSASSESMTTWTQEFRIAFPGKGVHWILCQSVPKSQPDGSVLWHGFATNVTARKLREESQRFQEELLEETGRIAKIGGWYFDVATGEGFWTDEVARIHDLDPSQPIDRDKGISYYVGESREIIDKAVKAAVEEGVPYDLELEIQTPAGNRKWVRTIGRPVRENGRIVQVRGSLQDVTQLRRINEELRLGVERFREVVETIQEVFWISDPARERISYVSPRFFGVWGRTCQSVCDSIAVWNDSIHPADRGRVLAALRAGRMRGGYDETYRILRPDGGIRWIRDKAFPVRDSGGAIQRLVGIVEDVTDRRELEDRFLRAQRLEAIGTLASGVAHDLNNILSPILLVGDVFREKLTSPRDRELIEMIERSGRRGADIVARLLTFSRGLDTPRGPLQPRHLLKETARLLEETLPRNISVALAVADDLSDVSADPTQLHQVLINLCVNARDAMPQGGRLTLGAANVVLGEADVAGHAPAKPGAYVALSVRDTGTGIPPEVLPHIFETFFTTKGTGKGTGLGLATVLGIVKSHDGLVTVATEPGAGTEFRVCLPALRTNAAAAPEEPRWAVPPGSGELILVVDDEEPICQVAASILESNGYRVSVAFDGASALDRLERNRAIRAVVTDVMMPVMDGLDLIRSIRKRWPDLPIVACSGLDQDGFHDDLRALGVNAFLTKPFAGLSLLESVRQALRG